jgi:adenylate kinase
MVPRFSNIAFIGGIHGVGKSTICKKICADLMIQYLSASEVLKWAELNNDPINKKVGNIFSTQERLINGLDRIIDKDEKYLLDGHYCLLDETNNITRIPFETFEIINPVSLHIIIGEISEIQSRLQLRDNNLYDYNLLDMMQKMEVEYASELSNKLNVNLSVGQEDDVVTIKEALYRITK